VGVDALHCASGIPRNDSVCVDFYNAIATSDFHTKPFQSAASG
jgi:hypothetical protein